MRARSRHRGAAVEWAANESRAWLRGLFLGLAREAGAGDPELLSRQLMLLYDGASVAGRMDRDVTAAAGARVAAGVLVEAATAA